MTPPDFRVYVLHIRDCCEQLAECRTLRERGGVPPSILLNAACRNLEIIGEASRKIGPEFRAAHPGIPWREMNDLRNPHPQLRGRGRGPDLGDCRTRDSGFAVGGSPHLGSGLKLSRDSPFHGRTFRGGPAATVVNGQLAWKRE